MAEMAARKIMPVGDDGEVRRRKRSDEALRKKKDERKHAARKRRHDKQNAAAIKIQSLVRGAQTRVYISATVAPESQIVISHNTNDSEREGKMEDSTINEDILLASPTSSPIPITNDYDQSKLTRENSQKSKQKLLNHDESKCSTMSPTKKSEPPPQQQVAATRLQASFRGYLVRKNSVSPCQEMTAKNHRSSSFNGAEAKRLDLADLRSNPLRESKDSEPPCKAAIWPTVMTLETPIDVSNDTTEVLVQKGSVRVFVMTWNLQAQKPPLDLSSLLRPGSCHIYAIGTEECVQTIAKSVIFQSKKEWEDQIRAALPGYIMLRSHALTAMHNMVFVHSCVYPLVSNLQSDAIGTGIGNQLGNKGGVGIGFQLGLTKFAFINSHFEAHQSQSALARRNANFHKINSELQLLGSTQDAGEDKRVQKAISEVFDRVFWCGDLNYRIDGTRRMIDDLLNRNFHNVLLANDQLSKERKAGRVFDHFEEGPLNFRPTYKFDKGCDIYDTSAKQRIPSWTDRILYSTLSPNAIRLLAYHSHMAIKTSDHRPVSAIFDVDFSHHDQSIRGSAVSNQTKSEVCSIQ